MREFFKNIKFVWKYAKSEKKRIIIYFLLSIVGVISSIIYPFISARIIVNLTSNQINQFIFMGFVIFTGYMINDTLYYFKNKLYEKIFRQIYINIQTNLGAEILKLSNKTLEENGSGVFIQRLVGDTRRISTIFTDLNRYFDGIISNIGIMVAYFVLSKVMFFFILIAFTIRFVIEILRINTYNKNDKEYRKNNDALTGFTGEIVRGAEDIKMLNGESSFLTELKRRFENLNNEKYEMENTNLSFLLCRWYWNQISYFLMIVIVGLLVKNGSIEIATAVVLFNFGNLLVLKYNCSSTIFNIKSNHLLIS